MTAGAFDDAFDRIDERFQRFERDFTRSLVSVAGWLLVILISTLISAVAAVEIIFR